MTEMNRIQMIVFDCAGTTTDYGGVAPSVVFDRVFREEGTCLTKEEINAPMGMAKKAHIRALLSCSSGDRQRNERHGASKRSMQMVLSATAVAKLPAFTMIKAHSFPWGTLITCAHRASPAARHLRNSMANFRMNILSMIAWMTPRGSMIRKK